MKFQIEYYSYSSYFDIGTKVHSWTSAIVAARDRVEIGIDFDALFGRIIMGICRGLTGSLKVGTR